MFHTLACRPGYLALLSFRVSPKSTSSSPPPGLACGEGKGVGCRIANRREGTTGIGIGASAASDSAGHIGALALHTGRQEDVTSLEIDNALAEIGFLADLLAGLGDRALNLKRTLASASGIVHWRGEDEVI